MIRKRQYCALDVYYNSEGGGEDVEIVLNVNLSMTETVHRACVVFNFGGVFAIASHRVAVCCFS